MNGVLYIVIAIFILGLAVIVHEFGHFIAGKALGFKIEELGIGFGPKIFKKQGKNYLFSLGLIPLGAFVRFLGEDENNPNDPRAMNNMLWWKRLVVLVAGPLFNILSAMLIIFILMFAIGKATTLNIDSINPDAPLAKTELVKGDKIVAINDVKVKNFEQLQNFIVAANGQDIVLTVERSGQQLAIPAQFYDIEGEKRLGITFESAPIGLGEAFIKSLRADWDLTKNIFVFLGQLVTGKADISGITGPVSTLGAMKNVMVQEQAMGVNLFYVIMELFWAISINVGLFNLLPIPALDGGRIVFVIIEGIRKKPINRNVEAMIHFVGFVALIVLVLGLEVYRFLPKP